jgi:CheY-like chemotaxis protein
MTHKPKILVVDDDQPILALMRSLLREFQFEPLTASSGAEALEIASRDVPDLILLDISMPKMSGEEAIRAFRCNPALARVPIVIVSGHTISPSEIARLGADGAIQKPFDVPDLVRNIRERLKVKLSS